MKEQAGEDPLRREGYRDGTWVLLDYGCVVVHVFSACLLYTSRCV